MDRARRGARGGLPEAHGLTRANLAERTLLVLRAGSGLAPDVLLVRGESGLAVVKDWARRGGALRAALGRLATRREARAYRQLAGHPAVPRLLGRVDPLALVLEHRAGPRFSARRPWTFSPAFAEELRGAVRGLHARGVAHLDLSHRSNVRAALDGSPVLIDFASAVSLRPGGLAARCLLPLLARLDLRALRKWERRLRARAGTRAARARAYSEGSRGASRPR
jgi:hypothetical protein